LPHPRTSSHLKAGLAAAATSASGPANAKQHSAAQAGSATNQKRRECYSSADSFGSA
jgi:hypothetical protein